MRRIIEAVNITSNIEKVLATILCIDSSEADNVNYNITTLCRDLIIDYNSYNLETSEYNETYTNHIDLLANAGILTITNKELDIPNYRIGSAFTDEQTTVYVIRVPKETNRLKIDLGSRIEVLDLFKDNTVLTGEAIVLVKIGIDDIRFCLNKCISLNDFNIADSIDEFLLGETYIPYKLIKTSVDQKLNHLYEHNNHLHDIYRGIQYFKSSDNIGNVRNEIYAKLGDIRIKNGVKYLCVADESFTDEYSTSKDFIIYEDK